MYAVKSTGSKPDKLLEHPERIGCRWVSLPGYMAASPHARERVLGPGGTKKIADGSQGKVLSGN